MTGTSWVAQQSVEMIENNANRPFFLFSSWIAPHPPMNCPDNWADTYKGVEFSPLSAASNQNTKKLELTRAPMADHDADSFNDTESSIMPKFPLSIMRWEKLLKKLEEIGELDNTLIILFSDHGEMLGDQGGCFEKGVPHEESVRIPLVLRFPKAIDANTQRDDCADLLDIFPTVLDAAGIDLPADIPYIGDSLLKPANQSKRDRNAAYIECYEDSNRWISLRSKTYKFNYWYGCKTEELYDLQNDPQESNNLLLGNLTDEQNATYEAMKSQPPCHGS